MNIKAWHLADFTEVLQALRTEHAHGLTATEATRRLSEHGANELQEGKSRTPWQILWEQLTATMVLILIAAAIISGGLGGILTDDK